MNIFIPGAQMAKELNGENVIRLFPWAVERLDAIKTIRDHEAEMRTSSTWCAGMLKKYGDSYTRAFSVPLPLWFTLIHNENYGDEFAYNQKLQERFLRANPEWGFVNPYTRRGI